MVLSNTVFAFSQSLFLHALWTEHKSEADTVTFLEHLPWDCLLPN